MRKTGEVVRTFVFAAMVVAGFSASPASAVSQKVSVLTSIEEAKTPAEREVFRQTFLRELEEFARTRPMGNVPRSDGEFLRVLVEASRSKRALEIGSSNGYSAIWIGIGLEQTGGKLITIEIDHDRAQMCKENIKRAGLEKVVTSIEGDALKVVAKLEGPFDFVFIDANKPDYKRYLDMLMPKMPVGGVIAAHNAIEMASSMRDYLDAVRNDPRFDTVIVSTTMRDGFAITYKKAE